MASTQGGSLSGVSAGIKLDGARRLRSTLRKAGVDMQQMKAAHNEVAKIIVTASGTRVPIRTGRLAASMRAASTNAASVVKAGTGIRGAVPYGNPIHWGWVERPSVRHPNARGGAIKPQPWLSMAAKESEPTWFAAYTKSIDRILSTIQGK